MVLFRTGRDKADDPRTHAFMGESGVFARGEAGWPL